ncbi:hypothetical protein ACS0TY_019521 [Phlomoides rotata]
MAYLEFFQYVINHYPLILEIKVRDWGPKPFRSIDAWLAHPEFKNFVNEKWSDYQVEGWGGYVVKEKFKKLKTDLKIWNKSVFGRLDDNIEKNRSEIQRLDVIDDVFDLEEAEIIRRKEDMAMLFRDLN